MDKKNGSDMESARELFGFREFRGPQREIIDHVITGHHCLVLMPTGMGKSLCYQIPALLSDDLTLVLSPLIALMKDQVDALKARGIDAQFINSSLSSSERNSRYEKVRKGATDSSMCLRNASEAPGFFPLSESGRLAFSP
jgi:ATP-dependent DNA helicase RecQ